MATEKKEKKKTVKYFIREAYETPSEVTDALIECIRNSDKQAFREILAGYVITVNKSKLIESAGIGRRTLYDLLDPTIDFNPSLNTVLALLDAIKKS